MGGLAREHVASTQVRHRLTLGDEGLDIAGSGLQLLYIYIFTRPGP